MNFLLIFLIWTWKLRFQNSKPYAQRTAHSICTLHIKRNIFTYATWYTRFRQHYPQIVGALDIDTHFDCHEIARGISFVGCIGIWQIKCVCVCVKYAILHATKKTSIRHLIKVCVNWVKWRKTHWGIYVCGGEKESSLDPLEVLRGDEWKKLRLWKSSQECLNRTRIASLLPLSTFFFGKFIVNTCCMFPFYAKT